MGFMHLNVRIAHVADPNAAADLEMLVDSGALYSIAPATFLRQLGIQPEQIETFALADGTPIERQVGFAKFGVAGRQTASNVMFGEPGDSSLLGVVTLEGLGFVLDFAHGGLKPIQFRLGRLAATAA